MSSDTNKNEESEVTGRRFPIWLIVILALGIGSIFALNYFAVELNDSLAQQDDGVIRILSGAIGLVCVVCLFTWVVFFSRWNVWATRVIPISLLVFSAVFLILYKPRHGGNIEIVGWEPRFWNTHVQIEDKNDLAKFQQSTQTGFWQYLGPDRNATIYGVEISATKPTIEWKKRIGKGWSGFAAAGDFAFTMEQSGNDELVTCYTINRGELVWSYRHKARYQDPTNMGGVGPRGTPSIVGDRIYAHGGTGILVCLNSNDGKLVWRKDVAELVGAKQLEKSTLSGLDYTMEDSRLIWGRSASPLIYRELVIVPGGGPRDGPYVSLIAFDRRSGEEVWRGGEEMISYGSASIATLDGKDVVTIVNEGSVSGHDPRTGAVLWTHERLGHSDTDANCSQPMQVGEDLILVGKGYGLGGELLRIKDNVVESVWKKSQVVKTKMTVPVIYDEHIYCLSDGILECTELQTGKRCWKKKRFGQGQILLVGSKLLVHSQSGTLHLIKATPEKYDEYQEFKINTVSGICWNMLALQDDQLLVRSELEAALIDLSLESESSTEEPSDSNSSPNPAQESNDGNN